MLLLLLLLWLLDQIIEKIRGWILLESQGLIALSRSREQPFLRNLACLLNHTWILYRDRPTNHLYQQVFLVRRLYFRTALFILSTRLRHTMHWLVNKASLVLQNRMIFGFALGLESDRWSKFVVFVVCYTTAFGAITGNISSCCTWTLVSISHQHQLRSLGK